MATSPIFIIGMPRSGTKLLRDILNNNQHISIPIYETVFIPSLINKYGLHPSFDETSINEIIHDIKNSFFYFYAKKDGFLFDEPHFKKNIDYNSLLSIIKYILQNFSEKKGEDILWGDKTPSYIDHVELLNSSFPEAKFIHIIRDPRDNVISANKVWHKNIYRVAQRWNDSIIKFKDYTDNNNINLLEIKFEELLDDPNGTINVICDYLGVDYDQQMLLLRKKVEHHGSTKNSTNIVSENKMKFLKTLSPKQLKKIEELAFTGINMYGYEAQTGEKQSHLSKSQLITYKTLDILNRIVFNFKDYGLVNGFKFTLLSLFRVNK
jgi:Sulfotransferase family